MKDYEEFKKAVYSRIEKGREAEQKRSRKILEFSIAGAVCVIFSFALIVVIKNMNNEKKKNSEEVNTEEAKVHENEVSEADRIMPFEGIYMYVPDEVPAGEFAGDMYRPDGYSEKIGSALALKLENSGEENYNVLIKCYNYNNSFDYEQFDRCVTEINVRKTDHSKNINVIEVKPVSRYYSAGNTKPEEKNDYFKNVILLAAKLTKEEILELADKVKGITLLYIGSGVRNNELLKEWEKSREGINAFCEAEGDMYVFEGNNIVCYPDIWEKE